MRQAKQIFGLILIIGILVYAVINSVGGDIVLKKNGVCTKGLLYRETSGGHTGRKFGYRFSLDGKRYTGLMAEDGILKIGDSICIVYWPSLPSVNRPLTYLDNGQINCGCRE
jgi:hypothetical protein